MKRRRLRKPIRIFLYIIAIIIFIALTMYTFFGAILQTSYRLSPVTESELISYES